ncbi:MAG TPA: UDP-N-acetylmuramate--L-alanine ligase [Casimicrobium sp.]|nr:UDP-N-acetylmuramate--L-alanine ligase [Casimicrobium sp.]
MKFRLQNLHFVGIGGIGMSGIAEVLHNQGYKVSGSDAANSPALERLGSLGIRVSVGHQAANLQDAQAVVVSTAINPSNPEVVAARSRKLPVVPRALMLAELMRMKRGIAIAGTHGKTTTTSLVASVLAEGGLDPTFVIGGRLLAAGSNARLGSGEFLVAEADESDASFLHLSPTLAVITNIDADHMETYGHSLDRLHQAFVDFAHRLPFYGSLYACLDDEGVAGILPRVVKPVVTYGLSEAADIRATDIRADASMMHFTAKRERYADLPVSVQVAGLHNVRNALAAIAIAQDLEVPADAIARALRNFGGVGRRFQRYGEITHNGVKFELIDDYGHHPVELKTTLAAARAAFPGRRLVLAFQPHRYTRTRDLFEDFASVLSDVDLLLLAEVYSAGEPPITAADGRALSRAIRLRGRVEPLFVEDIANLPADLLRVVRDEDVVMTMGAGSIGGVAQKIVLASSGGASVV